MNGVTDRGTEGGYVRSRHAGSRQEGLFAAEALRDSLSGSRSNVGQ